MDIKGDGFLLNGNYENFVESLSFFKMVVDIQCKMVRIVSLEVRFNCIFLDYFCLYLKVNKSSFCFCCVECLFVVNFYKL